MVSARFAPLPPTSLAPPSRSHTPTSLPPAPALLPRALIFGPRAFTPCPASRGTQVRLQGDFAKAPEKRFNYKHCFDALFRVRVLRAARSPPSCLTRSACFYFMFSVVMVIVALDVLRACSAPTRASDSRAV